MSSAELLARLNPKTQSYLARTGNFGALTPLDIAAGLAGAPQNAQRTALAAFAGYPEPLLPGLVEACGGSPRPRGGVPETSGLRKLRYGNTASPRGAGSAKEG